ncbi:MAG: hypothetical protein HXY37_00135, partial [Chloroflexi bacterium]|nr:hypothetical protein [Chloroflexota bacterium]
LLRDAGAPGAQRAAAIAGVQRAAGNAVVERALVRCSCEKWEQISREISTPVGDQARIRKDGSAILTVANVSVIVKPDATSRNRKMRKGAKTTFRLFWKRHRARFRAGALFAFTPPAITVTIQTTYGPGVDPASQSAYGKGTTDEDKQSGHTTLSYHEGSHGLDYIQYLQDNPPRMEVELGMARKDFNKAVEAFYTLMKSYAASMRKFSERRTDCVGTTIDQAGYTKEPVCQ